MGFVNQKGESQFEKTEKRVEAEGHANWMGGHSFDISNPLVRLRIAASTCFFGEPMYYQRDEKDKRPSRGMGVAARTSLSPAQLSRLREMLNGIEPLEWRGMSPAVLMENAIDAALDFDPAQTLAEAVRLRNEEHMRTTPQVILVRAAHHPKVRGTGMLRTYASGILRRTDEAAVGLAYQVGKYGKDAPIPNALKKAWRQFLETRNEYQMAKYRMEAREVKTIDVVNLVHPKSEVCDKLAKGKLHLDEQTWEAVISKNGSNTDSWRKALGVMDHMALLRNIRNLLDHGIEPATFVPKLVDGAKNGHQLPFRYFSAYKAISGAPGPVKDAVEECLTISLGNLPKFPGRVMALCDNSGSAWGATTSTMGSMHMAEIGNLQAVLAAMRADDGHVGIFGDRLEVFGARAKSSLFDQLEKCNELGQNIGHDTENGIWLFFDTAIRVKEHWDTVFIFSDMQAGHGGLYGIDPRQYRQYIWEGGDSPRYIDVPKLVAEYRRQVNPKVNIFLVQIAGYQDTILPEWYDRTYILGGWGEGLMRFAASMVNLYPKQ